MKTSTINQAGPEAHPDIPEPPRIWKTGRARGWEWKKICRPGRELVARFRPWIEQLASSGLSRKTIRKHIDNLWILGGEIIRDLNETPFLRRKNMKEILLDVIDDEEGGPLIPHCDSEEEQRSFDSTCRKFRRFLQSAR